MADPNRPYEDPYSALDQSIAATGKSKKEIAAIVYPGRRIETALSLLSRALTPENTDVNLNIEMIETIMSNTRPDDFIYYMCDRFGFERPERKKAALETELRMKMESMQRQMSEMFVMMKKMEKEKSE